MNASLRTTIQASISISDDDLDYMLTFFKPMILKKNNFFLKSGNYCSHVVYLKSGLLRIYYTNENGEEITCYFSLETEFVTSLASFSKEIRSIENIQAIVTTELLVISKIDLEKLYQELPNTQELGRKAIEKIALNMEKRIFLFLNKNAEERYQDMLKNSPILIKKVPLKYLASYLGITPQHLSRLRKTIVS
jgi:CRP-like cAMP-binding protein